MLNRKLFLNPYTAYIDGVNVMDYGAVVQSYKVSGTPVSQDYYQGRNRAAFTSIGCTLGMKSVTLVLFFAAYTQRELTLKKSTLDAALLGTPELHLPDGFYYRSVLQGAGELSMLGVEANKMIASCTYTFLGLQHDELQTVEGPAVMALGTFPEMPCRLQCTASQAYVTLQMGSVTFSNVQQDDVLVADGIDGLITINGTAAGTRATFTRLPRLVPGYQVITCPEDVTIEYYPSWI